MISPRRPDARSLRPSLAILAAAGLALAGCSASSSTSANPSDSETAAEEGQAPAAAESEAVAALGIEGLDARAAIDRLDRTPQAERERDVLASVRVDELLLRDADGAETTMPMPQDAFYLSVAPYETQTHECFYHSLTTCTGELPRTQVHVTVVDDAGQTLVDEDLETYDNGFVGMWLPRDISGTLTMTVDGKTGTAPIATGPEDLTCLTTLRVA